MLTTFLIDIFSYTNRQDIENARWSMLFVINDEFRIEASNLDAAYHQRS